MKVLALGANGQVGHELMAQINRDIHHVQATVRQPEPDSEYLALDLSKIESIAPIITSCQPDLVINAAAYTAVDKAEDEQDMAMRINADAVAEIARCCHKIGAGLIHYSTDYVFDGTGDQARSEDEATSPVNFYGKSKWLGEEAIRQSGCRHLIFRTSWVYGVHGHNFVKTMLKLGQNRKELSVVADQVGSPTSAAQIASYTLAVIHQLADNKASWEDITGTYHLAGEGFTNWAEFAQEIFRLGSSYHSDLGEVAVAGIPSSEYPTPAKRPLNSRLSCSKLEETFAIQRDSWQQQLKMVVNQLCSN